MQRTSVQPFWFTLKKTPLNNLKVCNDWLVFLVTDFIQMLILFMKRQILSETLVSRNKERSTHKCHERKAWEVNVTPRLSEAASMSPCVHSCFCQVCSFYWSKSTQLLCKRDRIRAATFPRGSMLLSAGTLSINRLTFGLTMLRTDAIT